MRSCFRILLLLALALSVSIGPAFAHVGPPFPILSDKEIPGYTVSIWTDPDIGEALFYLVLEPRDDAKAQGVSNVVFWVEPVNGRLPRKSYPVNQQKARRHLRFVATPEFDTQELWRAGVEIALADGSVHPFSAEVESTPPGLGPWDLMVYIFPFVLFGGLWVMVMVRKTIRKRSTRNATRSGPNAAKIANAPAGVYHEGAP